MRNLPNTEKMGKQNKWDTMAQDFPRFEPTLTPVQTQFYEALSELGVEFAGKNVLDIGAGTGRYTLHTAQKCAHITALDISPRMLEVMRQSAREHGISNLTTIVSEFGKFTPPEPFDIAYLTMSPAILDEADFEHFLSIARVHAYFSDIGGHDDSFVAHFSERFGDPAGEDIIVLLERFLRARGVECRSRDIVTHDEYEITPERGFEMISWQFRTRGIEFDEAALRREIDDIIARAGGVFAAQREIKLCVLVF